MPVVVIGRLLLLSFLSGAGGRITGSDVEAIVLACCGALLPIAIGIVASFHRDSQ
jgi:hypothetical protein